MKITATKIIQELQEKHGWDKNNLQQHQWIVEPLIKDVITIIDSKLKYYKGISIKR
jgi:hypothetical protein